ncbi:MAG: 2-hydroxyacyl-CoA dehydratase [Elusimicrobiaceae bacterium]|nr:2-hydroxyacyl-CoA dehydratase [Elusimicrobiaceae bacterium]
MSSENLFLGIDVGSTTVKVVIINANGEILFSTYQRHMSDVRRKIISILNEVSQKFPGKIFKLALTGSGALSLCTRLNLSFVQEVIASSLSIKNKIPNADVIIELGGEDAKLTFLTSGIDLRMNETCAGGTGAFIDQMASFLNMDIGEMDRLALTSKTIYPIASRCGVFAKTDIVPLINEGCAKSDIAMSIMQAVVNQFIGGLSRGRDITGTVVFLGGPLAFIKSLRKCFIQTLKLDETHAILPENAEIFVALGAALYALKSEEKDYKLNDLINSLENLGEENDIQKLPPLFKNKKEREDFLERHRKTNVENFPLEDYEGPAYLGIDSGSTTLKATLIDDQNRLLYSYYGSNNGDPFSLALNILKEIYTRKKPGLEIKAAAATGYGSALLKAGLKLDIDEVETVAHCTASTFFAPKATFVLDIGGQDIKCMSLKNGVIERIGLNEACSAGCGSFIENFAKSLHMKLPDFVEAALTAQHPVDLGTRCTVFMNSKVKQAQKEGAKVGDIAAGLSYSVIKNACYKVIKIHNVEELGDCIVAQGGSFLNDALLRALEIQVGKPVIRPGLSGLMGAFGAALLAKKRGPEDGKKTKLITTEEIAELKITTKNIRCQGCSNHCMLTITNFGGKQNFVSGNRCERGAGMAKNKHINLYEYKYNRLFNYYTPLAKEKAKRGTVGLPRALGMFETYPLWFTLLTELGFRVELSAPSSKNLFFSGYSSIPSQTVCYPAKIAHGHIIDLINKKVNNIFFPCLPKSQKEFASQEDFYNCPIVTSYPELLSKNITEVIQSGIPYYSPFLPLDEKILPQRLRKIKLFRRITLKTLKQAVKKAFAEQKKFREDIRKAGEAALKELEGKNEFGIILAGHPYHIDPAINHGIPELVNACGLAVLTEDSVSHLHSNFDKLWARDQWTFHSRMYHAGSFTENTDNLAVLQLVSFGCGVDAITAEQLEDIVNSKGRLYAQIKIDEGENLGPAKIRIRSLLAAMRDMKHDNIVKEKKENAPAQFTPEMKKTHTILVPQMSPIHFQFLEAMFESEGYKVVQLPTVSKEAIELGLKNVNNDVCYPAIVVIGQILQAIKDGKFDTHKIAILVSQTNGGCRASNYAGLLRRALAQCNMEYIPVLTLNVSGNTANQTGFSLGYKVLIRGLMVACYGDVLMQTMYRTRPYEKVAGSAQKLADDWAVRIKKNLKSGNLIKFAWNIFKIIRDFDKLPLKRMKRKPRVGLVGEILLKFHPDANNQAVSIVEQEGGEAVVPCLMDFMLYGFYDHIFNYRNMKGTWRSFAFSYLCIWAFELFRFPQRLGFWLSKRFEAPIYFKKLRQKARDVISLGHQTGEGWLLTAEIIELLGSGVRNVLCMQPFGCLPNHIVGKGFIKEIKKKYPTANIIAVDYDPGASETNQINRIKLMMSIAKQEN